MSNIPTPQEENKGILYKGKYYNNLDEINEAIASEGGGKINWDAPGQTAPTTGRYPTPSGETKPYLSFSNPQDNRSIEQQRLDQRATLEAYARWQKEEASQVTQRTNVWIPGQTPVVNLDRVSLTSGRMGAGSSGSVGFELEFANTTTQEFAGNVAKDFGNLFRHPFIWLRENVGKPYVARPAMYVGDRVAPEAVEDILGQVAGGISTAGSWVYDEFFKPYIRDASSVLMLPIELLENVAMVGADFYWREFSPSAGYEASEASTIERLKSIYANTTFYQSGAARWRTRNFEGGEGEFAYSPTGEGFFAAGQSLIDKNKYEEFIRPKLYGQTATVGRAAWLPLVETGAIQAGDDIHSLLTGFTDAGFVIFGDLNNYVKIGNYYKQLGVVADLPTTGATARQIQKLTKAGIALDPELWQDAKKAQEALSQVTENFDDAAELLTPKPGVTWSGDSKNPQPLAQMYDIDDPQFYFNNDNLMAAGLYSSSQPALGTSYIVPGSRVPIDTVLPEEIVSRVGQGLEKIPVPKPDEGVLYKVEFTPEMKIIDSELPYLEVTEGTPWSAENMFADLGWGREAIDTVLNGIAKNAVGLSKTELNDALYLLTAGDSKRKLALGTVKDFKKWASSQTFFDVRSAFEKLDDFSAMDIVNTRGSNTVRGALNSKYRAIFPNADQIVDDAIRRAANIDPFKVTDTPGASVQFYNQLDYTMTLIMQKRYNEYEELLNLVEMSTPSAVGKYQNDLVAAKAALDEVVMARYGITFDDLVARKGSKSSAMSGSIFFDENNKLVMFSDGDALQKIFRQENGWLLSRVKDDWTSNPFDDLFAYTYPETPAVIQEFGDIGIYKDVKLLFGQEGFSFGYRTEMPMTIRSKGRSQINEYFAAKGVDGFRYDGGKRLGGYGLHDAYAILRPSKTRITNSVGEQIVTSQANKLIAEGQSLKNYADALAQARGIQGASGLVKASSQAAPDLNKWEFFKTTGRYKNLSTYLASENNPYEIWRTALKRRSPELAVKLSGAKNADEITALLDTAVYDPDPLNYMRQLPGWSGNMVSEAGFRIKQTVSRQSNIFANMPRTPFIALDDLDEGARHLDDLMQVLKVPFEMQTEWMNKFLRAASITDNQVRKQTLFGFARDWEKAVIQQRLQPLVQKLMIKRGDTYASSQAANDLREFVDRVSRWRGRELDQTRVWVGDDMMQDVPLPYIDGDGIGPALTSELFNSNIYLIDPEDLDQVSKLFNMWSDTIYSLRKYPGFYQAGKAREFARTKLLDAMGLWKSGVLFGLRYTTRVVADEAMRVSMSGQFQGPFSYVSEILSGRLNVDTLGRALPRANEANNLLADITNIARLKEEFATALAAGDDVLAGRLEKAINKFNAKVQKDYPKLWEEYGDAQEVLDFRLTEVEIMLNDDGVTALDAMIGRKPGTAADVVLRENTPGYIRTRIQKIVDREKNPREWERGLADEIAGLSTEPDVREVAKALAYGGDETTFDSVAEWMFSGKGRKVFERYYKGVDKKAGYMWDTLAEARNRVDILRNMILRATGGNTDAIKLIAAGNFQDEFGNLVPLGVRTTEGPIANPRLRKYLREGIPDSGITPLYSDPNAPQKAAFFPSIPVAEQQQKRKIFGWWMQMTYGRASDKLARVPLFQALKWNKIADMTPMLSKEEGTRLANIVADLDLPEALKARVAANIDRAGVGTMTVETLDQFAGAWALEDNVNLLFDASKRSLFGKQHAFLFPFFDAYRETGATLLKLGLNPQNIHKVDIARQSLQNFRVGGPGETMLFGERDVNMDGRSEGMLYTDPNTGKQVVATPLFGSLASMWSDVPFNMAIPVSGFTMQSNVIPGVGPVIGLTYDAIGPQGQDWAWLNQLILPFGSPGERTASEYFIPTFAQRVIQGSLSNTQVGDALKGLFGDPRENEVFKFAHSRALQAFASSRIYPPGERGITQLAEESYDAALKLWAMRGLSQFFLPAAPITQYYAQVDKKLIPLGVLLDDIRATEQKIIKGGGSVADAQEASMKKWGDFIIPYFASLSKSTRPGSEPSTDFEKFRGDNEYLFERYPASAGLFHQSTGGYDFEVYDLQRRIGEREYLPPKELAKSIDGLMGGILYRRYENNLPVEIRNTPMGRAILSLKSSEIREAFPYWNPSAYAAERESEIRIIVREIEEASKDPKLAEIPAMPALQEYLAWRNGIIKKIRTTNPTLSPDGWKTANGGILERELLFQEGQRISTQNPAFKNLWDNLLSREFQRLTPEDMDALARRNMSQEVTTGG